MSLLATRMQNWRIKNPAFDKNMTRPLEYGALDFFIQQTQSPNAMLNSELQQKAMASIGNTIQIPVINYDSGVSVSNTRSCVIADSDNTSALYTVTFATYAIGFTMVPASHMNNDISYEQDFNRKLEKNVRALSIALDTAAIAALEAQKTQVFKDLLIYTQTGNEVQVPWVAREEILGDLNSLMRANAYPGQIHVIGNAGIDSMVRKMEQKAVYNEVNKTLEFSDKIMHYSHQLVNETGKFATAIAVEDGNVGILTRVDREAMRGAKSNDHEWDIIRLPFIDLPVGSHYYTAVGDQSAVNGAATADLTCAVKEYFGFSVDVAFVVAYNSDPTTIANPIIKSEIVKFVDNPLAQPVTVVSSSTNPVYTQEVV